MQVKCRYADWASSMFTEKSDTPSDGTSEHRVESPEGRKITGEVRQKGGDRYEGV